MTGQAAAVVDVQPTILLVDDDLFMLHLQSRLLARMGYRHVASAGAARGAMCSAAPA